ncbi:MAG: SPFH domain-containing protein [Clostridium sp.]|nr:SPFH domain-containing protein [Clostridium sp.]MCM1547664.1 SPFH domain-containing protein [Ruminococcus sp.]
MGLIKAAIGSVGGTLADQWKEFIYCDALPNDILVKKGRKKVSGRSSNTKGSDNVITNGSGIAVADGQCMIIVEKGKIVDICAEPGEFTYDTSSEPSLFCGSLGKGIKNTFKTIGKRFTYGGDTGTDQRVYYINTKELMDNKFGTPNPVPFRVVDANIGLDVDISVRCNGVYSYRIMDPLLFYTNVCGNVSEEYVREDIDRQLKSEFLNALQPAFAEISSMGVRYSALPGHTMELCEAMNKALNAKWQGQRGLEIISIGINSVNAPKEDEDMIKELQKTAVFRNPNMAGAAMVGAQADAMRAAASNSGGAMAGFMGMNMAQTAGGLNAQNLFAMGAQQQAAQESAQTAPAANGWKCSCGAVNTAKFCSECGKPKPADTNGWTCSCGAVNKGKFCAECGKPKPAGQPLYKCDKCGWEPEDPKNPPKFCPECGDIFDDNDVK